MNQLKKTQSVSTAVVVALGLAVFATDAFAGAVTQQTGQFSKQFTSRTGAVTAASVSRLPNATITTAAAYQSGDRMTITLGGTAGARFEVPDTPTLTCVDGGANAQGAWTYSAALSSATTAVFTAGGAGVTASICTFGAADLTNTTLGASAANGTITLSANLTRDVTTIDTAPAVSVATVVDQYSATVNLAWDGVIDYIGADGRLFTNADANTTRGAGGNFTIDDTANVDTLAVLLVDRRATVVTAADLDTTTGLTITINGDFSVLANTTEGCLLPGTNGGNFISVTDQAGNAIGAVTSTNCDSITVSLTAQQVADILATAQDLLLIRFNADNTVGVTTALPAGTAKDIKWQAFTGSASFSYTVASSAVVQQDAEASFAPGAHTASGSRIFVPYVPVGPTISQVVQLANNSARTGTVTMTAQNQNALACSSANMGGRVSVGANRIVDLSAMLAAGIANCYPTGSHKLYLVVTADIPDTAAELYTSYNVNGNRVAVVNSSNGRSTGDAALGGGNSTR